mmetsp:Transcript_5572/g.6016  ORF Transcript_5572/g.6016 Transcript_5572/m.6016 type:complete len:172 (+) Transcript_5572:176-691(+)
MACDGRTVYIHNISFGAAPIVIPASQVRRLLRFGDILVDSCSQSGSAAGIQWQANGSLTLTLNGRYRIQPTRHSDRSALRSAQFLCGVLGLMMINAILFFDASSRLANLKDFAINFSSDILAVGSVLLMAEFVDQKRREGSSFFIDPEDANFVPDPDEEDDMRQRPFQSAM